MAWGWRASLILELGNFIQSMLCEWWCDKMLWGCGVTWVESSYHKRRRKEKGDRWGSCMSCHNTISKLSLARLRQIVSVTFALILFIHTTLGIFGRCIPFLVIAPTMVCSKFGSFRHVWSKNAQTQCIAIILAQWISVHALGLDSYNLWHELWPVIYIAIFVSQTERRKSAEWLMVC